METKNNKELEVVKKKISGMQEMVNSTVVTNDDELALISDKIKNVKQMGKFVKERKDAFVAPAKEIIEQAKEMFDGPIKECINAEDMLKGKAQKYLQKKEDKRIAGEKKIADDLASGKIKNVETAVNKLEKLPEQQKSVNTGSSTLRMQKRNVAEIVDRSLIPDEFWVVDEVRVKKEALERAKNGVEQIPGVIIKEESTMVSM